MKVKFLKKTTCCLGGSDIQTFEEEAVIEVSEKLASLLIDGKQAQKTTAKLTDLETLTDKPDEVA